MNEENSFIRLLKNGDQVAYRRLVKLYYAELVAYLYRILKEKGTAKDTAQDVFMRLYEKRDSILEVGNIKSFLFTIARNKAFDVLSHQKKLPVSSIENNTVLVESHDWTNSNNPDRSFQLESLDFNLRALVVHLPARQKQIFLLRYDEKLDLYQIAQLLGISYSTAKGQLGTAVKKLRVLAKTSF